MLPSFFLSVAIHLVPHVAAALPNGQRNEQDAEHYHCGQELLNGLHRFSFWAVYLCPVATIKSQVCSKRLLPRSAVPPLSVDNQRLGTDFLLPSRRLLEIQVLLPTVLRYCPRQQRTKHLEAIAASARSTRIQSFYSSMGQFTSARWLERLLLLTRCVAPCRAPQLINAQPITYMKSRATKPACFPSSPKPL